MKNTSRFACALFASSFLLANAQEEKVYATTGTVQDVSSSVKWLEPQSIWIQPNGDQFIVDSGSHTIHTRTNNAAQSSVIGRNAGLDVYGLPLGGYLDVQVANAMFNGPTDVVVDNNGIVYISDSHNHSIRKVMDGVVYTHAGTGVAGYKNGDKTVAQFNSPAGLTIDAEGNLYVADTLNHVIRKVTPDGQVSTVAGAANEQGGYVDGSTMTARFNEPSDVALDEAGYLYVSDSGNQLIRRVADNNVTTYAGIAINFDADTGYFEGDYQMGTKETARFNFPKGLDYENGYLFVADSLNNQIRAIAPTGEVLTLAGKSEAGDVIGALQDAQFNLPSAVHYFNGALYVTDSGNRKVKAFPLNPKNVTAIQSADDLINSTALQPAGKVPQIWYNNTLLTFSEAVAPFRENDKLYIPVHAFFKQTEATVKQRLFKKDLLVTKNGKVTQLAITAPNFIIKNRQTYVEASYLKEVMNYQVADAADYNAFIIQGK